MVFRRLGIPFFGHNGEDGGEAMTAGDGEGLGVVGVVEHIVADGIEGGGECVGVRMRQCVGSEDAELNEVVATYNLIMNKLWFSAGIGQVASVQGDALAQRHGVFEYDKSVLYGSVVGIQQILGGHADNLRRAVVARRRQLHSAVVVAAEANRIVYNVFYLALVIPNEARLGSAVATGQHRQYYQNQYYKSVFHK